jgi:hypothetical protein
MNIGGKRKKFDQVKTKLVYSELINKLFSPPTSQRRWRSIIACESTDWTKAYVLVYESTIHVDTKLRCFQYKITMNCLYLNKDLFNFKVTEDPLSHYVYKKMKQ